MKANFALSLSFDGIKLLHHADGDWQPVGEVALDAPDLPDALSALRANAETIAAGQIASQLIIPNEQIKYLTIETGDIDEISRRAAAELALDGATPYAVADLAFDLATDGALTHIAAVARETLAEAEEFALQHGFNPISTVSLPENAAFEWEPFFGPTSSAEQFQLPIEADEPEVPAEEHSPETVDAEDSAEPPTEEIAPEADAQPSEAEPDADASPVAAAFSSRRKGNATTQRPALGGVTRDGEAHAQKPEGGQIVAASIPDQNEGLPLSEAEAQDIEPETSAGPEPDPAPQTDGEATEATETINEAAPAAADQLAALKGRLARRQDAADKPLSSEEEAKAAAREARALEERRLTVFGARDDRGPAVGGKPRYLGLILTALLLICMGAVALWSVVFLDVDVSRLFQRSAPETEVATVTTDAEQSPQSAVETPPAAQNTLLDTAPPPTFLEPEPAPVAGPISELAKAQHLFDATGIWTVPPFAPPPPRAVPLDDLYQTSIDPGYLSLDAVALPAPRDYARTDPRPSHGVPPPRGTQFEFDRRGLLVPTPEGAISPGGFTVFLGEPPLKPPARPAPDALDIPDAANPALAQTRPRARPEGLIEQAERRNLGGLTRAELAAMRPRIRPQSVQEQADQTPTALAAETSRRPDARPKDFARKVETARAKLPDAPAATPEPERETAAAPRSVTPSIPSSASVTRQATVNNAINLRRINLLGISGTPSDRSALVRLASGRTRKVQVGDRLDGGRVIAIGESELRYQKNGRNISLKMPRS